MQASAIPAKIQLPWASSGDKVVVPVPSQIPVTDGRASFTTGFPPLNATPLSAGGVAPFWTDFNGVLNQITAVQQWQCAGGFFKYDSAFAAAIGGYPKYAILQGAAGLLYQNTVDNNTTNPESSGVGWGAVLGTTPAVGDSSNQLATTAFVAALATRGNNLVTTAYESLNNTTAAVSASFSAPGPGILVAWGSKNMSTGDASARTSELSINGIVVDADFTNSNVSLFGRTVVTAGGTYSASMAGASDGPFKLRVMLQFIPNL